MNESKAEIQEKMNINWFILDKLSVNKCMCIYLLLFWQFETFMMQSHHI